MDAFTEQHLSAWLDGYAHDDERNEIEAKIRALVQRYPEMIEEGRSWPEILHLAERNAALGLAS